jgi:hypothetical protein
MMAKSVRARRVRLMVPHAPNRDAGALVRLVALGIEVPVGEWFELRQDRAQEALARYPWLVVEDQRARPAPKPENLKEV